MKNLLIVYPGGCGGNHLANLLSTSEIFNKFFISDSYCDDMLNEYKKLFETPSKLFFTDNNIVQNYHGIKAHFFDESDIQNLKDPIFLQKIQLSKKVSVLRGHEHDYTEIEHHSLLKNIADPFWIIMSYPEENSIPYRRIHAYKFTPNPRRYTFPFYPTLLSKNGRIGATYDNGIYFKTDKFFDKNGVVYLREILKPLNIELPSICDEMHNLWFSKICEVLELSP